VAAVLATIDRGAGHPVVLLHGQPGTGASWDPLLPHLEGDFRVLAPDRVGYGRTAAEARGVADNADLVARFMVERETGAATVVGHSWAGGAAALLASRHPALVTDLVLVAAACTPDSLNGLDRWLVAPGIGHALTLGGLVGIGGVLPRVRHFVRFAPAATRPRLAAILPDEGVVGEPWASLGRSTRSFMVEQRALVEEMPAIGSVLPTLAVPVSVVAGAWDIVVPPKAAVTLARSVPAAHLTLLPRAGHFVARDDPEGLAEVIRRSARLSG
jgi:pimeloyl-ACP methyl ester carboxylesterase